MSPSIYLFIHVMYARHTHLSHFSILQYFLLFFVESHCILRFSFFRNSRKLHPSTFLFPHYFLSSYYPTLQVSAYCRDRNLMIGGLYHSSRYFHDSGPDVFAFRTVDKILEQNNSAILLSVNNFGLASAVLNDGDRGENSFHVFNCLDGKWKQQQRSGVYVLSYCCCSLPILSPG